MNKMPRAAMLLMIAAFLIIAGCSSGKAPKDALLNAMQKTGEANSYAAQITFGIDQLANPQAKNSDPAAAIVTGLLQGAIFTADTVYQKEPLRVDMELGVKAGDLTLNLPLIMDGQKLYVKIPAIPLLQLPESIIGHYIEVDVEAIAAQQTSAEALDLEAQMELTQKVSAILMKHFDEKTFFRTMKADDVGLPDGIQASQIVRFKIDERNAAKSTDIMLNKVLPELLDLLASNDAYLQTAQLKKEDIQKLKADLESKKSDITDNLKINELSVIGAIKGDYLSYQSGKVDIAFTNALTNQTSTLAFHFDVKYSGVNEPAAFKNEIPKDAVKLEELTKLLNLPAIQ
ncbi:hypothetical protein [Paenibacillus sp. NPDC058071]|uniref:hypothetical protein n=1 Tax=Paenibacillus sp. NPDC058071 TaxID=3346326 RepID=UPI0036D781FC